MAKRTIHVLIDDLDGGDADETITFGLDGKQYEIDLSDANAAKLRAALEPYLVAGQKLGRSAITTSHSPYRPGQTLRRAPHYNDGVAERAEMRQWLATHGVQVAERGRVREQYVELWRQRDAAGAKAVAARQAALNGGSVTPAASTPAASVPAQAGPLPPATATANGKPAASKVAVKKVGAKT